MIKWRYIGIVFSRCTCLHVTRVER